MTKNASETRVGADLPAKPGTASYSSPATSVLPSLHPRWPESHLKLWNCIPFLGPIDSGAVSKMNGGFRKSILMKEKEKEKEVFAKRGTRRREGEPLKVVMKGRKENRERKVKRGPQKNVCMCLLNMCVELCVCGVTLSLVTRIGEGCTGLIWLQ